MKKNEVRKSLDLLKLKQLSRDQAKQLKGGSGDTTDDIVVVDVITT